MEKYHNYIKAVSFIGIFLIISCLLTLFLEPKDNTKKAGMEEIRAHGYLAEKENTIDVLFIGDSISFTSFSPMQMYEEHGFTSYDIGADAQKIFYTYYFLKDALKHQTPKLVVLETNTLFREYPVYDAIDGEVQYGVPLFRYHNRWKTFSLRDLNLNKDYTHKEVSKGFLIRTKANPIANTSYMNPKTPMVEMQDVNAYYVKKINDLCKKKGINFLIISSKTRKIWNYDKHYGMEKFAEETGIEYLDLNLISDIDIDWTTDTYDKGDHMNTAGAIKVSEYVGEYLDNKYNLPDHRQDKNYQDWNKDIPLYKKLIEESYEKDKKK